MQQQFWVIGADYRDMQFTDVVEGTSCILGPFGAYREAAQAWREQALATRYRATTRFRIVVNADSA